MLDASDVTAVLVTRGDQPEMIREILASLIFDHVIIYDNTQQLDCKTAGRYMPLRNPLRWKVPTSIAYFQDDDLLLPEASQRSLLDAYKPGVVVANWAHGDDPDGYDDLPLVGAGAILDKNLPWRALRRYLKHYPEDLLFRYEADFIAGALYENFEHVWLPFNINLDVAQDESRLCNQPWQRDRKFDATQRARAIRDGLLVAA